MEKMIKIKIKTSSLFGKKVTLPIDGEKEISPEGVLEVSEECATLLVEKTEDYSYIIDDSSDSKAVSKPKAEKSTKATKKAPKIVEEEEEEEETEDEAEFTKESLSVLEIEDLINILKDAKIDEEKYSKFVTKKSLLISFILKTIK